VPSQAPDSSYALLWQTKAGQGYVVRARQRFLRGSTDDPTYNKMQSLLDTRQQLARLLLAPADPLQGQARLERLQQLTNEKDQLERELAEKAPALHRETDRKLAKPEGLSALLPAHAVFVDLFRYHTPDAKNDQWGEARYAAFLLRHGQPIVRVELGDGDAP